MKSGGGVKIVDRQNYRHESKTLRMCAKLLIYKGFVILGKFGVETKFFLVCGL